MFTLHDLPAREILHNMVQRYPDLDPSAIESCLLLLRVATDFEIVAKEFFNKQGISTSRFMVLMLLNRNPEVGVSPSQLADMAGVTRATMTGLLDGLERDQFVTREHNREDRRAMKIRLTSEGLAFLDGILPEHFRRIETIMTNLNIEERKTLTTLLTNLRAGISMIRGS